MYKEGGEALQKLVEVMHFLAVDIDLREESHIGSYILRCQVAPLGEEICNIAVVEVITAQDIVGKGPVDSEALFPVAICKKSQFLQLFLRRLLLLLFAC